MAIVSLALSLLLAAEPQPLTEEQVARIRQLVQTTQTRAGELKARLDERQRELAEVYNQYELDRARAIKLQEEIVTLQRQFLENHHHMQVELRNIVGKERFLILKQRIERVLHSPPVEDKKETR